MLNRMSRDLSLKIHYILDQFVPPILRDSRWFMALPLRLVFGHRYRAYLDFKDKAYSMNEQQFRDYYKMVEDTAIKRDTDLNQASIDLIMANLSGPKVLDVGCGRGFLAALMAERSQVTGVDIWVPEPVRARYPQVQFQESNVEHLPFADKSFDTVVCTHTLEHVLNIHDAIAELRRVAKKLIIVVPRQRPYKYTFDLHLNFFPYPESLLSALGKTHNQVICRDADGDIFYVEQP